MIRPATPEDSAAVINLVIAAEMFSADDAWLVEGMLADYFDANKDDGHICVVDDEGGDAAVLGLLGERRVPVLDFGVVIFGEPGG